MCLVNYGGFVELKIVVPGGLLKSPEAHSYINSSSGASGV